MMLHLLSTRELRAARLAAILAPVALAACATSSSSPGGFEDSGSSMPTEDASAAPKDSGTTDKDTGTGTVADTGSPATMDSGTGGGGLALPFFVSDQFIPSGFMNDPTGITMSTGANGAAACPSRAPTSGGDCYVVTWTSTGPLWAGVYWQYPSNNWGTQPGLSVAPGATKVSFYARGDVGGEVVQFKAGGINDPIASANGSYGDGFAASSAAETLTTSWQQFTVSLQGSAYASGVLGGFCWVANTTDAGNGSIKFYVDDVQWQ